MTDITELTAKLKAAAQDEIMCREACDTSDLWQDEASPENVLALIDALEAAEKRIAELEARTLTPAANDVLAERLRQISAEGWAPEHDDEYQYCEMAVAAACYIMADDDPRAGVPELWPWPSEWWKPTNVRRDLVKAGALILAEIERLDRAAGIKLQIEGE